MPARDENGRFAPAPAPQSENDNDPTNLRLWRVEMPARGEFAAKTIGVYVAEDTVQQVLGGHSWMLWKPWNREVKPWIAKRGGHGTELKPGERLEL